MNLQELIQHARDNNLVVPASQLTAGQLAMIVVWGPSGSNYRDRAPGTLVMRQTNENYALIAVKSAHGEFNPGSWWAGDSLDDIQVMPLTPEHPGLVTPADMQINADNLSSGKIGLIVRWIDLESGAFERAALGCLVARERGGRLVVVQRSPDDTREHFSQGIFWSPQNVAQVMVVPVEIQFPYEVEA